MLQFQDVLNQLSLDSDIPGLQNLVLQVYHIVITFSEGKKQKSIIF